MKRLPRNFTTAEVYRHEKRLQKTHPENHNVRAKIRQQLQVLRDKGVLRQGQARALGHKFYEETQSSSRGC